MPDGGNERWQIGDLTIDVGTQAVLRAGRPLDLPKLSFKFLQALIHAAPNVVSVDELMARVWDGVFVNAETVTQRAKLLRDALGDNPKAPRYLVARRGRGYQLIAMPIRVAQNADLPRPPARPVPWRMVLAAFGGIAALGGLAGIALWPQASETASPGQVRIAVLGFDSLSRDPADAFIARSIPEMVLNRLASLDGLTVIARDSALAGAAGESAEAAGEQLGADYVVKGSVQRVGDTLRVTSYLVDISGGSRLWSERFDWPISQIYALQDRIAERVAVSLQTRMHGIGSIRRAQVASDNPDAYLAYLKGKSLLNRFTVAETEAAAAQFSRAVRLDPDFAPALVALFDAKMQAARIAGDDLPAVRRRYQPSLDRALQLDPGSGEALFAKASWAPDDMAFQERSDLFRRAAERDPSNARGLTAYALFLDTSSGARRSDSTGSTGRALLDRALSIDPLSPFARFRGVMRQGETLTPVQFERKLAEVLELDPAFYPAVLHHAKQLWFVRGETAEAIRRVEAVIATDPKNSNGPYSLAAMYLDVGDLRAARAVAATTPASQAMTQYLLAQYAGDLSAAGAAAMKLGRPRFGPGEHFNLAEAVRDWGLRSGQLDAAARRIAYHFHIDIANPRIGHSAQVLGAPALAHVLLAKGDHATATRLLTRTVGWIDAHRGRQPTRVRRVHAEALMLLGQRDRALDELRASFEQGHDIRQWWYVIEHEPIWAPVRRDPGFREIAKWCRAAAAEQRTRVDEMGRAGKIPSRTSSRRWP